MHSLSSPPVAPDVQAELQHAALTVAVPKATAETSFTLHAPLELLGRIGLLPYVARAEHGQAVDMIAELAARYADAGDPVDAPHAAPAGVVDHTSPQQAAARLLAAVRAGELDEVDALAVSLLPTVSPAEAVGLLGEGLVTSLAAAGHAPIGFSLLGRVRPVQPVALLRGPLRSLARRPDWQLRWHDDVRTVGDPSQLYDRVRATPKLGRPGSDFIFPLMSQVQDRGVAAELLGPVLADRFDTAAAARTLHRVAAWSMVHDDRSQAPYGWTHALTMPQAVMSLAGAGVTPRTALAIAGTFTIGFRAAHGTVELPEVIEPGPAPDATWTEVLTAAALHEDAHLVKFALAARHAADDDPQFEPLYRSAAAFLVEWWRT
jgi:hypothetical protein